MKKLLLSICAAAMLLTARADEGMWIPMLIGKNYAEMSRLGLTLSPDDLYSINNGSMKDAIVHFGGGCTGEMISSSGLLLTNHHCGYDAIATLSTVQKNYLDNGFWAKNHGEELPAEGLSVMFLDHMEDVTYEVRTAIAGAQGAEFNKRFAKIAKEIEEDAAEGGKYVANVREFFGGNQFFLLVYKKYTDVRLVATPPKSLGKFGGDTDNWMWPRHTADFSMFRVYAGRDNEPAKYSKSNVPYKPKHFLPINIQGPEEGDYAMIFGYPGRTNRYEVSYGVRLAINETNPAIVSIRDKRLAIMRKHMKSDKSVYLKLTSSYSRIANYWKYFIGQTEQLKRLGVVAQKQEEEEDFSMWARERDIRNGDLMNEFDAIYEKYQPYAKHGVYYGEAFRASTLAKLAASMDPLYKALKKGQDDPDSLRKYTKGIEDARKALMKEFDLGTEKEVLAEMTKMYYNNVPKEQHPAVYEDVIFAKHGRGANAYTAYSNYLHSNTFMLNSAKFNAFIKNPKLETLEKDPAFVYAMSFVNNFNENYQPKITEFNNDKRDLSRRYIRSLMKMRPGKNFYPDANSTMRITYGKVDGYSSSEGKNFKHFTTLDQLIAKYKPRDEEFDVPKELIALHKKKDYGVWADDDGTIHTCFITDNDITGGNSGSPVINGDGELIGCAFDGNWEAMSGDIAFDKKYKRTIVCDIRFILFLVDKLGKAPNIINEMEIYK
jgi:hypothetical protein